MCKKYLYNGQLKTNARPALFKNCCVVQCFFVLCCSVYCLCVYVYCTTATVCQPNRSLTNISYVMLRNISRQVEGTQDAP